MQISIKKIFDMFITNITVESSIDKLIFLVLFSILSISNSVFILKSSIIHSASLDKDSASLDKEISF